MQSMGTGESGNKESNDASAMNTCYNPTRVVKVKSSNSYKGIHNPTSQAPHPTSQTIAAPPFATSLVYENKPRLWLQSTPSKFYPYSSVTPAQRFVVLLTRKLRMYPIPIVHRRLEFLRPIHNLLLRCYHLCGCSCWLDAVVSRTRLRSVVAVELPDTGAHIAGAGSENAACGRGGDRDDFLLLVN